MVKRGAKRDLGESVPAPSCEMALNMPTVQKHTKPTIKTCAIGVWYHDG